MKTRPRKTKKTTPFATKCYVFTLENISVLQSAIYLLLTKIVKRFQCTTYRLNTRANKHAKNKQVSHLIFHPLLVIFFNVFGVFEVLCGYSLLTRLYRYKILSENKAALNNCPKRP